MIAPIRAFQLLAQEESAAFMRAKVHATILVLRRTGRLETANRVSEWQHCLTRGYAPTTLPGFPDDPSRGVPENLTYDDATEAERSAVIDDATASQPIKQSEKP